MFICTSPLKSPASASSLFSHSFMSLSIFLQKQKQEWVSRQRRRQRNAAWRQRNRAVLCATQCCSVCSVSPTQWQKIVSADSLFQNIRASIFLYGQALVTTLRKKNKSFYIYFVSQILCRETVVIIMFVFVKAPPALN